MNAAIPNARNAKINNQITPIPTIIQIDIPVISIIVRFHSVCSDPPILNRTAASEASRPRTGCHGPDCRAGTSTATIPSCGYGAQPCGRKLKPGCP